jgi:hypothetical protein
MAIRVDRRLIEVIILGFLGLALASGTVLSQTAPQLTDLFGLGEYPGGTLKVVFKLERRGENGAVHYHTVEIVPNQDLYDVTETIGSPGQSAEELSTGGGRSGAAGAVGAKYDEEKAATIDLSPLMTLEERNVEIEPNQNYYLPDGARLVTAGWEQIAGIDVIMATFLHPSFPNQRVELALAAPGTSALLAFPPLLIKEVNGEVQYRVELIEFVHTY